MAATAGAQVRPTQTAAEIFVEPPSSLRETYKRIDDEHSGSEQADVDKNWASGLRICSTGLSRPARSRLFLAVEAHGGRYFPSLKRGCTHLLVGPSVASGEKDSPKFNHAKRIHAKWHLGVVKLSWWDRCMEESQVAPENGYSLLTYSGNDAA
eukprot:scaffold83802_cov48-Prasinocladus_malaysianus.AAC.1